MLAGSKAAIKQAFAGSTVHTLAHKEQMAAFMQASAERGEAHRKKMEEVNKKAEPLDGVALGKALLKNLGFSS